MENLNETQGAVYNDDNDAAFEPVRRLGPGIVVRVRHWLSFGTPSEAPGGCRRAQEDAHGGLLTRFGAAAGKAPAGQASSVTSVSPLRQPLPDAVSLLSLEALENGTMLLRLAHKYGVAEGGQTANVSLGQLFSRTSSRSARLRSSASRRPGPSPTSAGCVGTPPGAFPRAAAAAAAAGRQRTARFKSHLGHSRSGRLR